MNTTIMNSIEIMNIGKLYKGLIIKRPSASCRSPYVADVMIENEQEDLEEINEKENHQIIAHAPALGCCGYADKDKYVYLTKHENPKLCTHVIHLAHVEERDQSYIIGMHPKSAEKIVFNCLNIGCIPSLENLTNIQKEKKFLNSRFDFLCEDKNKVKTIIEVKSVPCGDYEDITQKERKTKDYSDRNVFSKIAYFPDGYRKNIKDPVSPRALKHVQELQHMKENNESLRCILIFVIQRNDCVSFQASNLDMQYKDAIEEAYLKGVEIIPIQVHWNENGKCFYDKILPFIHKNHM